MAKILEALKWRIFGDYNPNAPVTENIIDRANNRARYEVWKYNTFGPGKEIYGRDYAYKIIDSRELQKKPLYINDPWMLAAMASIIAEMEGHKFISMMTPIGTMITEEEIKKEENQSIERIVNYYGFPYNFMEKMLEELKEYNKDINL